jgi:16S rRNA (cytidine1402-2'-O)-methyltransferase
MLMQFKEYIHPERQIAVVREISKFYEEIWRGTIDELIQKSQEKELKGEIVVVVSAL